MTKLLPLSLIFLLGCPVEPKDVQDLNSDGPGKPANGGPGGKMNGQPNMGGQGGNGQGGNGPGGGMGANGTPPEGTHPTPDFAYQPVDISSTGDGSGNQTMDGEPPQGGGDTVPTPPLGEGELKNPDGSIGEMQVVTDEGAQPQFQNVDIGDNNSAVNDAQGQFQNAPVGEVADTIGQQGEVQTPEGTHPTPDFAHQPGDIPNTAGDVLPMYQQPPSFSDFMKEEQINVSFTVSGATTFDYEFVVKREGEGRIYPKVVHKQSDATSPVEIKAPATMDEPVWLVITADKTGDGPTPDDLVGGTPSAIMLAGSDLTLSFTLEADEEFLKNLPWFSQAQGGPEFGQ